MPGASFISLSGCWSRRIPQLGECGAGGKCHGDGCRGGFFVLGVASGCFLAALDEFGVAFHELLARAAWDGAVATVVPGGDVAEEVGELVGDVGLGDSCIS